jgi:hypothetical protein
MYATVNVLAAGEPLKTPGVKVAAEPAKAPAQPAAPADDLPNTTPKTTASKSAPSPSASASPSPKAASSAVRTDKQIPIAVLCGALLSLTSYFL